MDDHSRDACIALLKEKYSVLGRLPQKSDFTEAETAMIKSLLGPWPRALEKAGVTASRTERKKYLTKTDFYLLGLSGGENCSARRDLIKKELGLPKKMSSNALIEILNIMLCEDEFHALLKRLEKLK